MNKLTLSGYAYTIKDRNKFISVYKTCSPKAKKAQMRHFNWAFSNSLLVSASSK